MYGETANSAKAEMIQSRYISKGKLEIKLETWSQQTSTKDYYILEACCKCWQNEDLIHSINWDYKVPRNGM